MEKIKWHMQRKDKLQHKLCKPGGNRDIFKALTEKSQLRNLYLETLFFQKYKAFLDK